MKNVMCKKISETPSLFRNITVSSMDQFSWTAAIQELQKKCPILLCLLSSLVNRNDHCNKRKHGESDYPGISMAIAAILKERNREICGIQTYVALVLFNSRVQKKVHKI